MNSVADMGGMHGFGPVRPSAEWKPFSADWERQILGIQFATLSAGMFSVDEIRFVTESIEPGRYLSSSYFERWVDTVEELLLAKGVVTEAELASGHAAEPAAEPSPIDAEVARMVVTTGGSARAEEGAPARFKVGDRVRARMMHPAGHTRLPRYVRGQPGEVVADYGIFVYPDSNAANEGPRPQHVYCVRFSARISWGPEANAKDTLQIDMFDEYLEPIGASGRDHTA